MTHRNPAIAASTYRTSLNPRRSTAERQETCLESGSRVRMVRHATTRQAMMTNATTRTAQPKPMRGMRCWSMIGKTTPPVALPPSAIPMAEARLRRNQWLITATDGLNLGSCVSTSLQNRVEGTQDAHKRKAKAEEDALGEEELVCVVFLCKRDYHHREHAERRPERDQDLHRDQ